MTSKKTTRRALFSSVIALILCCSMLVGTTFAWFTDSVTSVDNVITAGNLDIELYHKNVDQDETAYAAVGAESIFGDELWEPGHVEVVNLKIKNEGTLALKYQFNVSVAEEQGSINQKGNPFNLSDFIKFAIIDGAFSGTRAEAVAAAEAVGPVDVSNLAWSIPGAMAPNAIKEVTLVVWMPESVNNDANYKSGEAVPYVKLALNLFATQQEAESDSFGNDYDEDAIYTDAVVTTEAELVEALANGKDGMIIGIEGNVTWTTGAGHGSTPFVEAGSAIKNITLLGLGEDATFTAIGAGVGAIGIDGGTVTFKNLKIADESVSYAENSWELGYLEFRGNTVFENCDVVNAIMMEGNSATFKNCSFNSKKDSEYAVWVSEGNATFENCTFTGTRGIKIHEAYGSEVGKVVVNNNTFIELSKKPGMAIGDVNADTTVVVTNNEFIGTQKGDQGLYSYETDTAKDTFNFTYKNNIVAAQDSNLPKGLYQIDDTTWKATNTNALNAGVNEADEGDTIVLGADMAYTGNGYLNLTKDVTIDLNGNTLSTTTLGVVAKAGTIKNGTVSNPAGGRAALRTWSGVSIENVVVESPANGGITVASGNSLPYIKNVTINAKTYGIELQNYASVGLIENVTIIAGTNGIEAKGATIGEIVGCSIEAVNAGIWGQLKGTEDLNITVAGNNEIVGGSYGIYLCDEGANITTPGSAYLNYADDSVFSGSVKDMEFAFGQEGKLVINGSKVGAFISSAEELFAFAKAVNEEGKSFSGQTVFLTADIDLNNAAWTPIGQTGATQFRGIFDGNDYTISNLNIDSYAQTGANYSSGLFGWLNNATVKNVNVDGATVIGNHNVAVIAGYLETSGCTVSNCHVAKASVVAKHANNDACGDKVGVIVGHAGNAGVKVENCSAADCTVTAGRDAGQIVGAALTANVTGCTAENVTVTANGTCPDEKNVNNAVIGRVLG